MKIIISGALGHIGSYLIRDLPLRLDNLEICLIDNMLTQRYASLYNLPSLGNYNFIEGDITKIELNNIVKDSDLVIHLAAITDAASSFGRENEIEDNNYISTKRIVEACIKNNRKLITLSSTSVYGTQKDLVSEDCSSEDLEPQSPYAKTKLKEERLIMELNKKKKLKSTILRFGTIFGFSSGMRFHTAVNKFCWQAVMQQPVTVWETAYKQKRPYLDLFDASRAIVHIIEKNLFDGEIYNVLTMNATVEEIINEIKLIKNNLKVEFVKSKIMNQLSYEVSCKKFESTGFKFSGNIKRGIKETISSLEQVNKGKFNI